MLRFTSALIIGLILCGDSVAQGHNAIPAESKQLTAEGGSDVFLLKVIFGGGVLVLALACIGMVTVLRYKEKINETNTFWGIIFLGAVFGVILLVIVGISQEGLAAVTALVGTLFGYIIRDAMQNDQQGNGQAEGQ